MINLLSLKRQHEEIAEIVKNIKSIINSRNLGAQAGDTALLVNTLAGKLKIHLNTEDKYMYPELLNNKSGDIRNTAKNYMDEMGHISEAFLEYKDRFNTRTKIAANPSAFAEETNKVFTILEGRIAKEETSLYTLL